MNKYPIPSHQILKFRKNRSKNDPAYEKDLFDAIEHLLLHARMKRDIQLMHRTNRNSNRKTHQNRIEKETSIVNLMRSFILDSSLYEIYHVPQDLMFLRKFYKIYSGSITFSTLYTSFRNLKFKNFKKRFPSITFENLAISLQTNHNMSVDAQSLEDDYDIIQNFIQIFRSRT